LFDLIENEMVSCFDVDETLVLDRDPKNRTEERSSIFVLSPYDGSFNFRIPHEKHIQLLKQMHGRGRFIVVWSGAGAQWARNAIEALELEPYVHMILTKPIVFVDDLPVEKWMNNRVYLGEQK
jgi:hypothetical protein